MALTFIFAIISALFFSSSSTTAVSETETEPVIMQVSAPGQERLVSTLPGAESLAIATESGLRLTTGEESSEVGTKVPDGAVVMADGDPPTLLVGEHDGCMAGTSGSPLQRSDDGGETWTTVAEAGNIRPLVLWPDGVALAASCAGLHLSVDGGLTWSAVDDVPAGYDVTSYGVVNGDDDARIVLVGLTSEGGTSTLFALDLADPSAPVLSEGLRQYYAVGGLTGYGDTYVQVGIDGAWVSTDSGATWERQSDGLDGLVLDRDPLEFGLPQDLDPRSLGMDAVTISGDGQTVIASTKQGLYQRPLTRGAWTAVPGTTGAAEALVLSGDGTIVLSVAEGVVTESTLSLP